MAYIELINNFWRLNKEHLFTAYEAQVYFKLLDTCNSLGWKNPFNQSNSFICAECGMSEPKLIQVRNKLQQVGLIKFESGKVMRQLSTYKILGLTTFSQNDNLNSSLNGSLTDSLNGQNCLDNIRYKNNNTIHIDNNILFEQIKNLPEYLKNFQGNKLYLFVAYRFWELWKKENPTNLTVKNANVSKWYHEVRKIVEIDKTTIERLIGIYTYFKQIQKGEAGFRRFWFDTIKSIHGIRKKNKAGEYYLDRIITEVNEELERNEDFERLVVDLIQKTKDYASNKIPKKQI